MKKIIGYCLLLILILTIGLAIYGITKFNNTFFNETPVHTKLIHNSESIYFKWANQELNGKIESQTALLIPIKLDKLKHNFSMQFDTGSQDSYLYEKDLISLRNLGIDFKEKILNGIRFVDSLEMIMGGQPVTLNMIKIYPDYGTVFDAEVNPNKNYKIGTLGSDVLVNKVTLIDFKNGMIQFFDNRPDWMKSINDFKHFNFTARRILLPAIIDDNEYEFLYDSGCSAFGLITTKQRFEKYSLQSTPTISYSANSWNDKIHINSKSTDYPFILGNKHLTLSRVSCVDMYAFLQPLLTPFTRIDGWLGNQAIIKNKLIIDTKTREFLIL